MYLVSGAYLLHQEIIGCRSSDVNILSDLIHVQLS